LVVGQVSAVHLAPPGETGGALLIQLTNAVGAAEAVVPLPGAELTAAGIAVPYPAAEIEAGPTAEPGARLSLGEVASAFAYYGAGRVRLDGRRLTERISGFGDVAAQDPALRPLPPIVVVRPDHSAADPADG
jgi:hypothetical protein